MKATGIVRRIDDLGRVVIPKEIRRTMRIREGDPLEIYTDREGEVIFKKYSPIGELAGFSSQYAETLYKTCNMSVIICDRDTVIAGAGVPRKDFIDKRVSEGTEAVMDGRNVWTYHPGDHPFEVIADGNASWYVSCMMPIVTEGDVIGSVSTVFPASEIETHRVTEMETKLIQTAAGFLGRQLET